MPQNDSREASAAGEGADRARRYRVATGVDCRGGRSGGGLDPRLAEEPAMTFADRMSGVAGMDFTERQARSLVQDMPHAGGLPGPPILRVRADRLRAEERRLFQKLFDNRLATRDPFPVLEIFWRRTIVKRATCCPRTI